MVIWLAAPAATQAKKERCYITGNSECNFVRTKGAIKGQTCLLYQFDRSHDHGVCTWVAGNRLGGC